MSRPTLSVRTPWPVVTHMIIALLALTACDDGGPGRTIVPTEMPFAEMFRLVRVVTPEQSPESPIALISGARWDGDRIAIADVSEGNAKLFDSDGSLIATMGRSGEGPGEFTSARHIDFLDGRLLVAGGQGGRVSVWTGGGELDREIEIRLGYVSDFAALPDGRLVFTGQGFGRSESALGVYSADGTQLMHGLNTNDVLPAFERRCIRAGRFAQAVHTVMLTLQFVMYSVQFRSSGLRSALLLGQIAVLFASRRALPARQRATVSHLVVVVVVACLAGSDSLRLVPATCDFRFARGGGRPVPS